MVKNINTVASVHRVLQNNKDQKILKANTFSTDLQCVFVCGRLVCLMRCQELINAAMPINGALAKTSPPASPVHASV
jgi:hypothetical protein